jgi:hypothetical protein
MEDLDLLFVLDLLTFDLQDYEFYTAREGNLLAFLELDAVRNMLLDYTDKTYMGAQRGASSKSFDLHLPYQKTISDEAGPTRLDPNIWCPFYLIYRQNL